jgi:hypothetical protein
MKTSAPQSQKLSSLVFQAFLAILVASSAFESQAQDQVVYELQPNTIAIGPAKTYDLYLSASDKSALDTVTVEAPDGWGLKIKGKPTLVDDNKVMLVTIELDEFAEPGEVRLRVRKGTTTRTTVLNLMRRKPVKPDTEGGAYAFVTLMDPNNVADVFGSRIAKRYVALQVTIENYNERLDYLIRDVSLDLNKVFPYPNPSPSPSPTPSNEITQDQKRKGPPLATKHPDEEGPQRGRYSYRLSSIELSLLRGVAEKGQGQSTRNLLLRLLRATGSIAASFIGVTSVGHSYAPAVAMFNGPVLTSYTDAFPDYTINQLNRLNDSAYRANTLVPKGQSKVLVVFIPQAAFLTDEQRSVFKKNPLPLAFPQNGEIDFRRAEAIVHGSLIEEVNNQPPSITTGRFDSDSVANFQNAKPVVKGRIIGKYLLDTDIKFADDTKDLSLVQEGTASDNELRFVVKSDKPVKAGRVLSLEVSNSKGRQIYSLPISYTPAPPEIAKAEPKEGTQDTTELEIKLTGKYFPDDLQPSDVKFDPEPGIKVTAVKDLTPESVKLVLKIDKDAGVGERKLRVRTSEPTTFIIKKKPS